MNALKALAAVLALLFVTGCASQSQQNYYAAIQQAAEANARQQEARYQALATMASSGDATTQAAATMAIAMTQDKILAPQYVESEALTWGRILAAPVAAVAGIAIQADVAKNASDNATKVQMANFQSQERIQLGNQAMVLGLGAQYATSQTQSAAQTATTLEAVTALGLAGFDALGAAGDRTVGVATAGLDATQAVAGQGMTGIQAVAGQGMTAIQDTAELGLTSVTTVTEQGFDLAEGMNEAALDSLINLTEESYDFNANSFQQISNDYRQIVDNLLLTP